MNEPLEEWRKIPSFPTYEASDFGRIRHNGKVLTPVTTAYGYQQCTICFDGKRFTRFINAPSNLRWATAKENNADKVIHGTWQGGENHALAKLCDAKIKEIRQLHDRGVDQLSISERYGVARRTVNSIVRRQAWKHVA